jgi:hypothetical protein
MPEQNTGPLIASGGRSMLEQVLNREFVLNRLQEVRKYLQSPEEQVRAARRGAAQPEPMSAKDRNLVLQEIQHTGCTSLLIRTQVTPGIARQI